MFGLTALSMRLECFKYSKIFDVMFYAIKKQVGHRHQHPIGRKASHLFVALGNRPFHFTSTPQRWISDNAASTSVKQSFSRQSQPKEHIG